MAGGSKALGALGTPARVCPLLGLGGWEEHHGASPQCGPGWMSRMRPCSTQLRDATGLLQPAPQAQKHLYPLVQGWGLHPNMRFPPTAWCPCSWIWGAQDRDNATTTNCHPIAHFKQYS